MPRSRGGTDDEWNFEDLTEYEHAYEHALDFVLFESAPQMDFRMKGWPLLPDDLREACLKEHAKRNRLHRPLPRHFEHQSKAGKRGGSVAGPRGIRTTTSQKWMSLVDGFIGNPGNVARHNKSIGADPNLRVHLDFCPR